MRKHVRCLCVGGPFEGEVMIAPLTRPTPGARPALVVRIDGNSDHWGPGRPADPWIGGGYLLTHADPAYQHAAEEVCRLFGEPRDFRYCWKWITGETLEQWNSTAEVWLYTERMARRHVVCDWHAVTPEVAPALVRLMADLGITAQHHPDGSLSFRDSFPDVEP